MKMVKDWESVKEETGNENDGSNNPIASSEGSASDSPPHKRASHDDPPKRVVMDISKLPIDEYIALSFKLLQKVPELKLDGEAQFREYAEIILAHYKQKEGQDYEFTGEKFICPYRFPSGYKGTHLNFYARRKGSKSHPQELFYAELDPREDKVYNCCILPEQPVGSSIIHPKGVVCKGCAGGKLGFKLGYGAWDMDIPDEYLNGRKPVDRNAICRMV